MFKKSLRTLTIKKILTIGFLMIFLCAFTIETIYSAQFENLSELSESGEESDEEQSENSGKELNSDLIIIDSTIQFLSVRLTTVLRENNTPEKTFLKSIICPPPDVI